MSEYAYRSLAAPAEVTLPSAAWHDGYARAVVGIPGLQHRTADAALAVVKNMLDPVLADLASGVLGSRDARMERGPRRKARAVPFRRFILQSARQFARSCQATCG